MIGKKGNPLTLVFHYPDGTESETLSTEFAKMLTECIGDAVSELMSDESYISLTELAEEENKLQ